MNGKLFVDTSAWFAFFDRGSREHAAVVRTLTSWDGRLVFTDHILDELLTLVRVRAGHRTAVRVGEALLSGDAGLLVEVEARDFRAAWELFRTQADKGYSFTDCTSFAVMNRLGIRTAAALDRHFARAGFEVLPETGAR